MRLILSHVPTTNHVTGETPKDGIFTRTGGGANVYLDRLRSQEEIHAFCDKVFEKVDKISFEDFMAFN